MAELLAWERVREALITGIKDGTWPVGSRIPTTDDLAAQHGVSITPVKQAVSDLRSRGVLVGRSGAGVFVHAVPGDLAPDPAPGVPASLRRELDDLRSRIEALESRTT